MDMTLKVIAPKNALLNGRALLLPLRLAGVGWDEGGVPKFKTRGEAPSPGMSTKNALIQPPAKRGEGKPPP
jgi:hypothetical protein